MHTLLSGTLQGYFQELCTALNPSPPEYTKPLANEHVYQTDFRCCCWFLAEACVFVLNNVHAWTRVAPPGGLLQVDKYALRFRYGMYHRGKAHQDINTVVPKCAPPLYSLRRRSYMHGNRPWRVLQIFFRSIALLADRPGSHYARTSGSVECACGS